MSDRLSALARFQEHRAAAIEAEQHTAKQKAKSGPADSWEDLLKNLELKPDLRHNITQAFDAEGDPEWRVRSMYLLTKVIGIAPERVTSAHQRRLGTVMRNIGWTGPKNIWFGQEQAKGYFGGYFKAAEDVSP